MRSRKVFRMKRLICLMKIQLLITWIASFQIIKVSVIWLQLKSLWKIIWELWEVKIIFSIWSSQLLTLYLQHSKAVRITRMFNKVLWMIAQKSSKKIIMEWLKIILKIKKNCWQVKMLRMQKKQSSSLMKFKNGRRK